MSYRIFDSDGPKLRVPLNLLPLAYPESPYSYFWLLTDSERTESSISGYSHLDISTQKPIRRDVRLHVRTEMQNADLEEGP